MGIGISAYANMWIRKSDKSMGLNGGFRTLNGALIAGEVYIKFLVKVIYGLYVYNILIDTIMYNMQKPQKHKLVYKAC
jgi:hypothetical protein